MGTRGLIRVFDGNTEILCLYRQFDCYPDGLGSELAAFCGSKRIVNGIRGDADPTKIANGPGCLAAQLVVALKGGKAIVGSVYVEAAGAKDCGEEYEYHVKCMPIVFGSDVESSAVEVEGFKVSGGRSGKPRKLERIEIPAVAA